MVERSAVNRLVVGSSPTWGDPKYLKHIVLLIKKKKRMLKKKFGPGMTCHKRKIFLTDSQKIFFFRTHMVGLVFVYKNEKGNGPIF